MRLALRFLLRDWRAGELRVLALALIVAVTSVTSVSFFADRVTRALVRDAHQLLGGDLLLTADAPFSDALRNEIKSRGLTIAESTSFPSMSRSGEQAQLSAVKAVDEAYPLRGKLKIANAPNAPDTEVAHGPKPGSVWMDERLPPALDVRVGDSIELGNSKLRIEAILTMEPDRGMSFFNIAPRVMMNIADLPATGLIQVGSRASYQIYIAGEPKAVEAFATWVKPQLKRGQNVQSLDNARPEIRQALARAQQFLGLTALLAVILAAVAIGLATRRYVQRHLDGYAVMRCLGATQPRLFALFAWEFVSLGAVACAVGCVLGLGAQALIGLWLAELANARLPWPSVLPALQGFAIGLVLLLGFALPPLVQLKNVSALRVIRRDVGMPKSSVIGSYLAALSALAFLLIWQAGDVKLGLYVLGGFAGALCVFALASYTGLRVLARAASAGSLTWRYGLASLRRRSATNTVQAVSLSLGLMAILLLTFTRTDLVDAWRAKMPQNAPNRFIVNIQPEQREPVTQFFAASKVEPPITYPMVRGRLIAINDKPINDELTDERARRMVEREFNLSFMSELPRHNRLVASNWFSSDELARGALSIEEGIAKTLGVKIGDRLTWQVAGKLITAPITNVRKLDWDSMQVNFFVITTPALLEEAPTSYITAFNLPGGQGPLMAKLSQAFPNLTVIDMSAILKQALNVMDQVIRAVQFVFLFALGAGILVLYSALLTTQDERVQEAALMRALGASRAQIGAAQQAEFIALGLLAGVLASAGASAVGALLAIKVFQFDYVLNAWVWIAGPALGLLCVGLNSWVGGRAALNHPPLLALREA